jgi:hypothetical protein
MTHNPGPAKTLWIKLLALLEREMSLTLVFWLVVFLIVALLKISGAMK